MSNSDEPSKLVIPEELQHLVDETSEKKSRQLRGWAEQSFKDHELSLVESGEKVEVWYCGRPDGSSVYHFYVAFTPHAISVYGDIGDMLIRPGWNRGLGWLRSALHDGADEHFSYLLGKVPSHRAKKNFFPGDVIEHLQEEAAGRNGYFDEDQCLAKSQELIDEWAERVGYSYIDGGEPRDWWDACNAKGLDYEYAGGFEDYDSDMYWCAYALRWFVRKWVATYEAGEAGAEAHPLP